MNHHIKIIRRYQHEKWFLSLVLVWVLAGIYFYVTYTPVISPCPNECKNAITKMKPLSADQWVDIYSMKYGKSKWSQLRTKALLHFMLLRESAYGNTKSCGDSGLACGPLQFHEETYISYRKIMASRGLSVAIGSRLDLEDSIECAAWAINDGRENAWGPVARGEIIL